MGEGVGVVTAGVHAEASNIKSARWSSVLSFNVYSLLFYLELSNDDFTWRKVPFSVR